MWKFTDNLGSFQFNHADKIKTLYFPLANEKLFSSISPDLHGDIKSGQHAFLLPPVSRIDLINLKATRNFWVCIGKDKVWSATGVSKDYKQINADEFELSAGLLWQRIKRSNKNIGLSCETLSFIPAGGEPVEIMQVTLTNISRNRITFISTAAIPIYGRSANNVRDHRQVTSLLQRVKLHKYGAVVKPTLLFDESGHKPNKLSYFVLGWGQKQQAPQYIYPTQEMFCGESGDLEYPESVFKNILPSLKYIQGKESFAGLRFPKRYLKPRESFTYTIVMGITEDIREVNTIVRRFRTRRRINDAWEKTKKFWIGQSSKISFSTGDARFDNWFRWVSIQPALRRILGCSFLPDFDYGKGGRGWRDLWQDCLGLILSAPKQVRPMLINNFSGVRIDGSNATIIGSRPGEFISDRNNISRVWMDHGVWPLLTLNLYLNETGDYDILFEETTYYHDYQLFRAVQHAPRWDISYGQNLKDASGRVYKGTILEHLLVQNLTQSFNVGRHNHIRLEGADWNDGLDMAGENGESVAFSCMYAYNLELLADLLEKTGRPKIKIAKELSILLEKTNYNEIKCKRQLLERYFQKIKFTVSAEKYSVDASRLSQELRKRAEWMKGHIRKKEWLSLGFFNGYYDNIGRRVEGRMNRNIRMSLASQVFPIMSGTASDWQINRIWKSAIKHLLNKKIKGFHLNTDFKQEQHNLGRAFSFIYGEKENGAIFNHMAVMFANALYKRGYVKEGWFVLGAIYKMAGDTPVSKIYPCIPEYFNLEGKGMYSYLTGSASWFVLTLLTEVFGIKGKEGALLIEPKLCDTQFKYTKVITVKHNFAGRRFQTNFLNPQGLSWGEYRIISARLNSRALPLATEKSLIIPRPQLLGLYTDRVHILDISLG